MYGIELFSQEILLWEEWLELWVRSGKQKKNRCINNRNLQDFCYEKVQHDVAKYTQIKNTMNNSIETNKQVQRQNVALYLQL